MADVAIIGSGIIGLATAYELDRRGVDCLLIDSREPGTAASDGNTGWVVPVLSSPVPAPGLPHQVVRWMLQNNAPFRVSLRHLPLHARWLSSFLRNCNATDYQRGLTALGRLNAASYQGFRRWRDEGLNFEWESPGVLFAAEDAGPIAHLVYDVNSLLNDGFQPVSWLDKCELRAAEPACADVLTCGVLAAREQYVRPEDVIDALRNATRHVRQVTSRANRIERTSSGFRIETADSTLSSDNLVIAAGAWSGEVGVQLGLQLPVIAGKGYSITVEDPTIRLRRPLYLADGKIASTPFNGANRFAGMMELTGNDDSLEPARLVAMTTALDRYLPGWAQGSRRSAWVGLRPMTPDGLPLIGKHRATPGVYVASGHGMLGLTMAPVTGEIIADLMTNGETAHAIDAFAPDRFNARVWNMRRRGTYEPLTT